MQPGFALAPPLVPGKVSQYSIPCLSGKKGPGDEGELLPTIKDSSHQLGSSRVARLVFSNSGLFPGTFL